MLISPIAGSVESKQIFYRLTDCVVPFRAYSEFISKFKQNYSYDQFIYVCLKKVSFSRNCTELFFYRNYSAENNN